MVLLPASFLLGGQTISCPSLVDWCCFFKGHAKHVVIVVLPSNLLETLNHTLDPLFLMLFLILLFKGLTFVEKWNTDNSFASEITIEDQLINGLKLSFDTQLVPHTGFVASDFLIVHPPFRNCRFFVVFET